MISIIALPEKYEIFFFLFGNHHAVEYPLDKMNSTQIIVIRFPLGNNGGLAQRILGPIVELKDFPVVLIAVILIERRDKLFRQSVQSHP